MRIVPSPSWSEPFQRAFAVRVGMSDFSLCVRLTGSIPRCWRECVLVPTQNKEPERYEPVPGLLDLPGWLWRRMPPVAKGALVVAFVGLIAVALIIGPDIRESKSEREKAEQQQRECARKANGPGSRASSGRAS